MDLLARLRVLCEHSPPGTMISLPVDWLRAELETEAAPLPEGSHGSGEPLTVKQVADRLGRSGSTVRGWLSEGCFPNAFRLRGKEWRVPLSDLRGFLDREAAGRRAPVEDPQPPAESSDLGSWRQVRRVG